MSGLTIVDNWISYSAAGTNGALTGVYNEVGSYSASNPLSYVLQNAYVLQNGINGLGFYKVKDANSIKITSFRAYLTAPTNAPSLSIIFPGENDITGISTTLVNNEKVNGEFYNLKGQRVAQPSKGLYIVNGKKYVIK